MEERKTKLGTGKGDEKANIINSLSQWPAFKCIPTWKVKKIPLNQSFDCCIEQNVIWDELAIETR